MTRYFRAVALVGMLLLGACNMAISDHPMFGEKQRSKKVVLENGIWLQAKDDCVFDRKLPKEEWPTCAGWLELRDNRVVAASDASEGELPQAILIVDGKPPLVQAPVETRPNITIYGYLAIEPILYSKLHRVTEARIWPIPCGISIGTGASPKVDPYPGFSAECIPTTVEALRHAASKGPADPSDVVNVVWIDTPPDK